MSNQEFENSGDYNAVLKREKELEEAARRALVFQEVNVNLPGGYHRCAIAEGYPFLFITKSFEALVGYTKEEIEKELDNKYINLVIPEDLPRFRFFENEIATKGVADVAYRIRRRDGEIRWIQDSSLAVKRNGEAYIQCTISDISDFVHQQEEFAKEKAAYESLAANVPCGYHRCSTDGGFKLEFVSDSFLETVGYTKEEIFGKPFFDLIAPEDRDRFMSHEPELASTGKVELVYRIVQKNGSRRWVKDSTMKIFHNGKESYQCILADITDFVVRQEEMLQKNLELIKKENVMETIEKSMPGGYHRCASKEGWPFLYFGTSFEKTTGWTKKEIEEEFDNLFLNMVLEEDITLCSEIISDIEKYGHSNALYRLKKKGGGYIWVSGSTMSVNIDNEKIYHGVISDVTRQIVELENAKHEAENSNLAKTTFLFNASHDIRTPMNAIQGFAHIIEKNHDNPEIVKKNINKILQSSNTLMTLLNDVLDLSRIERGKDHVEEKPLNMESHIKELYEMFASDMNKAGLNFLMENDIKNPNVLGDNLKLTRIAMNLLSNAKKFTPRGGKVTFGVKETESTSDKAVYSLFVRDTGIGMSEDFQKRAFDQFERERSSTESGIFGSGLGLAIIKRLSDLMGGKCTIKSEIGKGSEITVSVPLKTTNENITKEKSNANDLNFSGKHILIVEDNSFNREIAHFVFESLGFEIDEAENGVVCLDKLNNSKDNFYDIILMDIQMPIMDGYSTTREIRNNKNKNISNIPIVAMTANAFDEDRKKCFDVGMNGHISKPLQTESVVKELSRVLKHLS